MVIIVSVYSYKFNEICVVLSIVGRRGIVQQIVKISVFLLDLGKYIEDEIKDKSVKDSNNVWFIFSGP